jgi:hypothetical protein
MIRTIYFCTLVNCACTEGMLIFRYFPRHICVSTCWSEYANIAKTQFTKRNEELIELAHSLPPTANAVIMAISFLFSQKIAVTK